MTTQELRELDAWIAERVMGKREAEVLRDLIDGRFIRNADGEILMWRGRPNHPRVEAWRPTTNSSDAMDVLKKCAENTWNVFIRKTSDGLWIVGYIATDKAELALFSEDKSLETAICLFAKQLFSQTIQSNHQMNTKQTTSRSDHLAWCKKRALEYCDIGDINQAYASMTSDLQKHPETANHIAIKLGMLMMFSGQLKSPSEMRKFIEGFN